MLLTEEEVQDMSDYELSSLQGEIAELLLSVSTEKVKRMYSEAP